MRLTLPLHLGGAPLRLCRFVFLLFILCGPVAGENSLFELDSAQISSSLDLYLQQAKQAIADHNIRLARQQISLLSFKIEKYASSIDKKSYEAKVGLLKASIKRSVDSLVQVNLVVIKNNGQAAGIDFRRQCAAAGLSETELAPVDEAIVNSGSAEERPPTSNAAQPATAPEPPRLQPRVQSNDTVKKQESPRYAQQPVMAPPPPVPSPAAQPSEAPHTDISPAAWQPMESAQQAPEAAPARPQSPDAYAESPEKGKSIAAANVAKIYTLVNQREFEEAMTVFKLYQVNLQMFLSPEDFQRVKAAVETAYPKIKRPATARRILPGPSMIWLTRIALPTHIPCFTITVKT